jgi:hypothetical protein
VGVLDEAFSARAANVKYAAEAAVFGRHIGVLPALAGKFLRNEVIRADSGGIDRVSRGDA